MPQEPTRPAVRGAFQDPHRTASGAPRAGVPRETLDTLWFNTGTLCNVACRNCYIESSPANDRLAFLDAGDVADYLEEIERDELGTRRIGFTGGEPFVNPETPAMLETCLARGFEVLVLTNAMRPMTRRKSALRPLAERFGPRLTLRVSIDHPTAAGHERLRGPRTWEPMVAGLRWLAGSGFRLVVAGRTCWDESEDELRAGYANLFADLALALDARDPADLVLFPEMDHAVEVPEITTGCWAVLGVSPSSMMCATSRMVVKRRGAAHPVVVACALIPYDPGFELGPRLADAAGEVKLNHRHCAQFCVLGGASCAR